MKFIIGPLTWAFVILLGSVMVTPGGIVIISANPIVHTLVGASLISLGVMGFIDLRGKSSYG